jgi:hypothetical protein
LLRKPTLFVLGAGASFELGMPLGVTLAVQIADYLKFKFDYSRIIEGNFDLFEALRSHFSSSDRDQSKLNSHLNAASRVRNGIRIARSVDNYVDFHRGDLEVQMMAKLAIFDCILKGEKASKLSQKPDGSKSLYDVDKLEKTWIHEFVSLLFDGVSKDQLDNVFTNLSVISFNYDRCLQQGLVLALHNLYHLDLSSCNNLVDKLEIVYPYGSLGPLNSRASAEAIPFGVDMYKGLLFEKSKAIRTYTEQQMDTSEIEKIESFVIKSQNIVFLGCAFHPQNIKALTARSNSFDKTIIGTAFEISDDGVLQIAARFVDAFYSLTEGNCSSESTAAQLIGSKIKLRNDLKCFDLMKEYRQTLIK